MSRKTRFAAVCAAAALFCTGCSNAADSANSNGITAGSTAATTAPVEQLPPASDQTVTRKELPPATPDESVPVSQINQTQTGVSAGNAGSAQPPASQTEPAKPVTGKVTTSVVAGSLTATGLTMHIDNKTNGELVFGRRFNIEKPDDPTWENTLGEMVVQEDAIIVSAGGSTDFAFDWGGYCTMTPGAYKLVFSGWVDGKTVGLSVNFTVAKQGKVTVKLAEGSLTATGLTIQINNNTAGEFSFGRQFNLVKTDDPAWENSLDEMVVSDDMLIVPSGGSTTHTFDWGGFCTTTPGIYKLTFAGWADGKTADYSVNFTVAAKNKVTVEGVSATGLTMVIDNTSAKDLDYNAGYKIYRVTGGKRAEVTPFLTEDFPDMLYTVAAGKKAHLKISWGGNYGALKAGSYVLVRTGWQGEKKLELAAKFTVADDGRLTMSVRAQDVSAEEISVFIYNGTDTTYTYGEDYSIYRVKNGKYTALEPLHELVWNALAMGVAPGKSSKEYTVWTDTYGTLAPGDYALVREFESESGIKLLVPANFTIK
ncbi:MAG: hypothetical protein QM689_12945 [Oscillospiraceae bacterium]